MRTSLGNKPLSHALKDPVIIKDTLEEMVRIDKIKKEEELYSNPKTKMFGMLLKAARLKKEEIKDQKKSEEEAKKMEALNKLFEKKR